jgi:hypothetical protein
MITSIFKQFLTTPKSVICFSDVRPSIRQSGPVSACITTAHTVEVYVNFGISNYYKEIYPKALNLFKTKEEYQAICFNI